MQRCTVELNSNSDRRWNRLLADVYATIEKDDRGLACLVLSSDKNSHSANADGDDADAQTITKPVKAAAAASKSAKTGTGICVSLDNGGRLFPSDKDGGFGLNSRHIGCLMHFKRRDTHLDPFRRRLERALSKDLDLDSLPLYDNRCGPVNRKEASTAIDPKAQRLLAGIGKPLNSATVRVSVQGGSTSTAAPTAASSAGSIPVSLKQDKENLRQHPEASRLAGRVSLSPEFAESPVVRTAFGMYSNASAQGMSTPLQKQESAWPSSVRLPTSSPLSSPPGHMSASQSSKDTQTPHLAQLNRHRMLSLSARRSTSPAVSHPYKSPLTSRQFNSDSIRAGNGIKYHQYYQEPARRAVGFRNMGQTCYIAASLQLLFFSPIADTLLQACSSLESVDLSGSLVALLVQLFRDMRALKQVSVLDVKAKVAHAFGQFDSNEQQDAHEFLMACLELYTEETRNLAAAVTFKDPVKLLPLPIAFEIRHRFVCTSCKAETTKTETSLDLPVHLPNEASTVDMTVPLATLLKASMAPERVDLICTSCGHATADVLHSVERWPRMLLIHIKRFGICDGEMVKRLLPIAAPLTLSPDALRLAGQSPQAERAPTEMYELRGVVSHLGRTLSSGHYVYDKFDAATKQWTRFDDSVVSSFAASAVSTALGEIPDRLQKTAYVLVFLMRDPPQQRARS